jgi:hypothetical protein
MGARRKACISKVTEIWGVQLAEERAIAEKCNKGGTCSFVNGVLRYEE